MGGGIRGICAKMLDALDNTIGDTISTLNDKVDMVHGHLSVLPYSALWANHLKGWCIFWNWPLSGLQDVEVCAGLLQSVSRGAAECVQGYRVCAGCSFNILPCSSRLNQKIFY